MKELLPSTAHADANRTVLFGTTVGLSADLLLRGQLSWFRERGWDVVLVTSPDESANRAASREQVDLRGLSMKRTISLLDDFKGLLRWIRLLREISPRAVNLASPKASLLGGIAAWLTRVPKRVYVVWGLRLEGETGVMKLLLWLMERLSIALSTDVVVVSESLGKQLVRRKLANSSQIMMVGKGSSNGVDFEAINARIENVDPLRLRNRLGLDESDFVVGYVGRINYDKGVNTLLEALQSDNVPPSCKLLIIGAVEDDDLADTIKHMQHRVRIVPWTDDVWGHYPAMDVLCLPTKREGFPNVVLEAAASGVPTITTRATGAVDSVIEGKTGLLFDVDDTQGLVNHLNYLCTDRAAIKYLGRNARCRARVDFTPVEIWRGIEDILTGRYDSRRIRTFDGCATS